MNLPIHELANVFPSMSGEEFAALKADIQSNGLLEPIWLYDGKVLDGRHRYLACQELGVEPAFREYEGSDPRGFVVSLNLKRRHLDATQRAAVAAELANLNHGQRADLSRDANLHLSPVTREEAATLLNVSPRSVATASKVKDESPEIFAAMKSGDISAHLAAQVIDLPPEERDVVEAAAPEDMQGVARAAVRAHVANNSGNNEWYTPSQYIEAARAAMGGIDTDPASCELANKTVMAERFFDKQSDGLLQEWSGNVWMNPPYAQPLIAQFCEKAAASYEAGDISAAIVLVNNGTETAWGQRLLSSASAVCFPQSRIRFIDKDGNPSGAPLQGQMIVYFGGDTAAFRKEFRGFGTVFVA